LKGETKDGQTAVVKIHDLENSAYVLLGKTFRGRQLGNVM